MITSDKGVELLKKHEGLRLTAYPDPATGGEPWTIGYGTTSAAGVGKISRGMRITKEQAEDMLRRSLVSYEQGVLKALKRVPTQPQFDAMVSLAYNIGVPRFSTSSVVRHFNAYDDAKAAGAFLLWNKAAGKVMPGLTRRRQEERDLFLTPGPVASVPPPQRVEPAPAPTPPGATPEPEAKPEQNLARIVIIALGAAIAAAAAFIFGGKP